METASLYGSCEWNEAQSRAETYLRALRGGFGPLEREQLTAAMNLARVHANERAQHPVTRVMQSLFDLLRAKNGITAIAMTPPIHRVSMLPERMKFPLENGWRRLVAGQFLPIAGVQ
jgi:hypothetical protein